MRFLEGLIAFSVYLWPFWISDISLSLSCILAGVSPLTVPPRKNRRAVPRFKIWVGCSVLPRLSDEDFQGQAVLGYVKDLSRQAVAVLFPSNETYGVNVSSLGQHVQMNLALPIGYVKLSGTLVRFAPDESGKSVFVFKIEESKERAKYDEYLDSLESDLSGASKDSLRHRLSIIETKLDPDKQVED